MVVTIDKKDIEHLWTIHSAYNQVLSVIRNVVALEDRTDTSLRSMYIKFASVGVFDFDMLKLHTYDVHRKYIDYVATYFAKKLSVDICVTEIHDVLLPKAPTAPCDTCEHGICRYEIAMQKYDKELDQFYTKLVQTTLNYNDVVNVIREM